MVADDATVAICTDVTGVSLPLGGTRVEDEGGKAVWEVDREVDGVVGTGEGGEDDKGVGVSGVDCSG